MEAKPEGAAPRLEVLETVRCLACAAIYSKPARGGTATANPGCPECGYVGWASTSAPLKEQGRQRHFGADPLRLQSP